MTDSARYRRICTDGFDVMPALEADEPSLGWIRVDRLVLDETYQRPIEQRGRANINAIASEFDWGRFTPLLVAPISGGDYAVIDGQHRAHAAALRGIKLVPAMVVQMDEASQARAFAWVNGRITAITPFHILKAALAAGEPWAVEADRVVREAGCWLATCNKSARQKKPCEIFCIVAVRELVERGRSDLILAGLQSLGRCKDADDPFVWSSAVLIPWLRVIEEKELAARQSVLNTFMARTAVLEVVRKVDVLRTHQDYFSEPRPRMIKASLGALLGASLKRHEQGDAA